MNHSRQQAFYCRLELAILGGVYERINAAVGEHHHHGEVVEPGGKVVEPGREVDITAEQTHDAVELIT